MYYDEITKTWFTSEIHAREYHATGATWDVDRYTAEAEEDAAEAWKEYELMEEEAGNLETGVHYLTKALEQLLSGQATTRAARNALRADLEERLPACVLEYAGMSSILRPERDARGRVV